LAWLLEICENNIQMAVVHDMMRRVKVLHSALE